MDQTDQHILTILQQQGRISMTDLGKQVGLTQPAVAERVRRLEDKGILTGYRAAVSPAAIGKTISAYLLFHTKSCDDFIAFCSRSADVMECHRISGQYNYLLKVTTESMHSLEAFINASSKYGDSSTMIVMSSPIEHNLLIPQLLEAGGK
ncbi:DNA-binding transcriptional regulator, Lrp family [Paenibacillus algorifonticola]|uniref:DNA-binding transcriptional regulator, Lrp family n=1 Tax=Paenibacillus algorifonticola TaxID=684063 RepID=A0A1I2GBW6_9BACL|nr:Lrp/AsnC family transcriptional regulator [Paenibacillus algorifonticola]SFF14417.1 DNA-binding transcriptional regulator, Lrp family [Paenibacillus algorifonticola]